MSESLDVLVRVDNKQANREIKETKGELKGLDRTVRNMNQSLTSARAGLGSGLKKAGIGAAAGLAVLTLAGVKAVGAVGSLISAGSEVEEMMGKYNTVFADGAGTTEELTANLDEFAALVGRNKYDLRGYAAAFGDTFKPLGFATDEAADLSETMTQLTVDLASFNNMSEDDVAARLQSTLIGNHGNVLKFGVIINEATLQQELMRMGMEDLTGAALEQAKVQARLNLIIAGTTDAQGDAERTSGSWANQMRRLRSAWNQTKADMGVTLLPVFTPILTQINTMLADKLPALSTAFADWISGIDFEAATEKLGEFIDGVTKKIEGLAEGEGLDIDFAALLGIDTEGLEIPVTFKRSGFVFASPLADLGLNQAGNLEVDLDFSMQEDEKIAWGDVFSFERNVRLGTSDIKIQWGDVFAFERDATFKPVITKLKLGDVLELEGVKDIGEFYKITSLKVGGLDLSGIAKVTWEDLVEWPEDWAFKNIIETPTWVDALDSILTGWEYPPDPMASWEYPPSPTPGWSWMPSPTADWRIPRPGWVNELLGWNPFGGGGGGGDTGASVDGGTNDRLPPGGIFGTEILEPSREGGGFSDGPPTRGERSSSSTRSLSGNVIVNASVSNDIDMEVLAHRIAEIQQRRMVLA